MTNTAAGAGFRRRTGHVLKAAAASPCAWFYAAVWFAAAVVLSAGGHDLPVAGMAVGGVLLLLSLLVAGATEPAPAVTARACPARRRVWVQLGVAAVFIAFTAWNGLAFHHVIGGDAGIPLWTPLVEWLRGLGEQWFGAGRGNFLANPVTYTVLPLAALLLAGARLPALGFGKGHRPGRALLICCAIPAAWLAFTLVSGQQTALRLLGTLASNVMQNGFFEEFLFRGALQTRLRLLAGPGWALVLQALVFGVWHLGLGYTNTGHTGLLPAIAVIILQQSLIGLALGTLFERTRNLLVPSVVHIAVNSM
jgi:membrane protease YdiL (CAAX protease family)